MEQRIDSHSKSNFAFPRLGRLWILPSTQMDSLSNLLKFLNVPIYVFFIFHCSAKLSINTFHTSPCRYTGPSVDHTTGTDQGYYLYIEASGSTGKKGDKASLVTEHIQASSIDHCFTLWYHMKGNGM